jgi:uncharacterized membrane protein
VEAALIPGLLIGGAAVLAPRLLPRDMLSGLGDKLRRTAPSPVPVPSAPTAHSAEPASSGEPTNTWRAVVKTFTYRVMVTTVDFGANYFVIGELATAAGLSSLSLVAGPIAYFAHEAAWHYYGPASARHPNPLEATVHVPIPGAAEGEENGRTRFARVKVSRAFGQNGHLRGRDRGVGICRQLSFRPRSRGRRRSHRLQHRDQPLRLLRAWKGLGLLRRHESPIVSGPGPEAIAGGLGVVRHGANKVAGLIGLFLAVKMLTKFVGILPLTRYFQFNRREGMYTTLMMSTGLIFGSISALFGLTNHIIDQLQYTILLTAVIGSKLIAQIWFRPHFEPLEEDA